MALVITGGIQTKGLLSLILVKLGANNFHACECHILGPYNCAPIWNVIAQLQCSSLCFSNNNSHPIHIKFKEAHEHNSTFIIVSTAPETRKNHPSLIIFIIKDKVANEYQRCSSVLFNWSASKKESRTRFVLPRILPGQLQDLDYGMLRPALKQTWGGACTLGTWTCDDIFPLDWGKFYPKSLTFYIYEIVLTSIVTLKFNLS